MGVFVSYSSRDTALVEQLAATLRRARQDVWFDDELGGGDAWWRMILDKVRDADVIVVALSQNALRSKACQAEVQYALALGKPVLPVQMGPVDSMRTSPLAAMQVIDYRNPTIDTGVELVAALQAQRSRPQELPDPLPEEPPMPFAYLMRLGGLIDSPDLPPYQQTSIVAELRAGLADDGDDPMARRDIAGLLQRLGNRSDVTYRTRTEVDALLASLSSAGPGVSGGQAGPTGPGVSAGQAWPTGPVGPATRSPVPGGSTPYPPPPAAPMRAAGATGAEHNSKKWWIVGGSVVAALGAVIAVVLANSGPKPAAPPDATQPTPSPTTANDAPVSPRSVLLPPDQVASIMNVDSIDPMPIFAELDGNPPQMSRPECLGAGYNVMKSVYEGSGYSAVAAQNLQAKGYDYLWVNQAVVTFASPSQAQAFFNSSTRQWQACAGATITATPSGGPAAEWSFGDVDGDDHQLVQVSTQVGTGGYGCQHVMRRESSVLIEAMACRTPPGDEASRITEAMAEKLATG